MLILFCSGCHWPAAGRGAAGGAGAAPQRRGPRAPAVLSCAVPSLFLLGSPPWPGAAACGWGRASRWRCRRWQPCPAPPGAVPCSPMSKPCPQSCPHSAA